MDSRAAITLISWVAVTTISVAYIWVGGVNIGNYAVVGLLVLTAFIVTIVAFGAPSGFLSESRRETTSETALLNELKNIKTKLDALTKEVEEIKKAIEE